MIGRLLRRIDFALLIAAMGAFLRVWQWGRGRSLWLDEQLVSLNLRANDLPGLAGFQDNGQGAPLGWLWLERIVMHILGDGERALRLPSLLFGVGVLALAWWIGRRHLGRAGGAVLVALFAFTPWMVIYSDQVKHYSGDVFFVLLLLVMAARVFEEPLSRKRIWQFWLAGAVGLWLGMGAFLVLPGLALVITLRTWRSHGWRALLPHALPGLAFAASFAGHYLLSLRHTTGSSYLADYWAGIGYPADGSGPAGVALWFAEALARLSENPLDLWQLHPISRAGAVVAGLFWLLVAAGLAIALRKRLDHGLLLLMPLGSGLVLALAHVVPLAARLALWLVPALYLAVAVAVATAAKTLAKPVGESSRSRLLLTWRLQKDGRVSAMAAAAMAVALLFPLALAPLAYRSLSTVSGEPDLDDRAAVAWMAQQHQPGDLLLLVAASTRAQQWYDLDNRLAPTHMAVSAPAGPGCDPNGLRNAVRGYKRVIAYAGVRYSPYLETHAVLRDQLAELGTIVETRRFGTLGIVYVVEMAVAQLADPGQSRVDSAQCVITY